MIRYDLKCSKGHRFDSWFSSSADFDKLSRAGLLSCVACGDTDIEKAVMAPRVTQSAPRPESEPRPDTQAPALEPQALQELRPHIESTATDVGRDFASEARKMHTGETPKRPIYGEAKVEEAKSLLEDGVPVLPLPWTSRKIN